MFNLKSLNPCSNGIQKYSFKSFEKTYQPICLNPCSNGIQKYSDWEWDASENLGVLILVLMEYKNTDEDGKEVCAEGES